MKITRKVVVGVACMGAIAGFSIVGGTASADPSGAPTYRVMSVMGSDTTQDVMNGFAGDVTASGSNYKYTGLLWEAITISDTTIKTSLGGLVANDVITIQDGASGGANSEQVTIVSLDSSPTANTLSTNTGTGNAVPYYTYTVTRASNSTTAVAHAANSVVIGGFVANGTKVLASYNSQGGAVQVKAQANCAYIANNSGSGDKYVGTTQNNSVQASATANSTYLSGGRANGSGNGARSMADAFTKTNGMWGCIDAGRASSKRSSVSGLGAGNTVNIPFALDAVAFAVTTTSNFTRTLSPTDIRAIYRCTYSGMIPASGGSATYSVANRTLNGSSIQNYAAANSLLYATLPQAGSGTRDFVVTALGLSTNLSATSGDTGAACITDKTPTGGVLEEHNLVTLDDNGIGVTSIAQSITQREQSPTTGVTDRQGRTVLVALDNRAASNNSTTYGNGQVNYPTTMTVQFGGGSGTTSGAMVMWREVFNAVPLARLSDPNIQAMFVGTGSSICTDANGVKQQYGFAAMPSGCGAT
ncbi:MAG: hypothetical protein F2881_09640, partial [Actinobacteria bacterium]|nr:hypothetical protein [Actinomycetota bacterium]